jgi:hypothetical protein
MSAMPVSVSAPLLKSTLPPVVVAGTPKVPECLLPRLAHS